MQLLCSPIKVRNENNDPTLGPLTFSEAFGISPNGYYITGTFGKKTDPNLVLATEFHGFVHISAGGGLGIFFIPYDHPNSPGPGGTSILGINDRGDVVGFYRDELTRNKEIHGFLWLSSENTPYEFERSLGNKKSANPDIPFAISFPRADTATGANVDAKVLHNAVQGINHQGSVSVGIYKDRMDNKDYGYIWGPAGPQIDDLAHGPQKVDMGMFVKGGVVSTQVCGVASDNHFVGNYVDGNGSHGFKWKLEWDTQWFDGDPLLPIDISGAVATTIKGINRDLSIVGSYQTIATGRPDGRGTTDHGFVWKPDSAGRYVPGEHSPVEFPDAYDTVINGISSDGTFVGYYRKPINPTDPTTVVRRALWAVSYLELSL